MDMIPRRRDLTTPLNHQAVPRALHLIRTVPMVTAKNRQVRCANLRADPALATAARSGDIK